MNPAIPDKSTVFYVTGGTLASDAASYVTRQADTDLYNGLLASEYCYVLNSRQMGKSSLCVRTMGKLQAAGVQTAFVDLTRFGGRNLTAEQWYLGLCTEIGRALGLRTEFLAYWKEQSGISPLSRLFGAVREVGLARLSSPFVIFLDEIDVTRSLPFSADEFFIAIRQLFIGRATDPELKRLAFCLLGTATSTELIQDTRISPFNIGKRISLDDFTEAEAAPLALGLGRENVESGKALLARILYWTGGHPYLTQRLCSALTTTIPDNQPPTSTFVDSLCSELFLTQKAKEADDNLAFVRNRLLKSEVDLVSLLDLYRRVRVGKRVPDDETNPLCGVLKLSGVARAENGLLRVRNRIYARVFDLKWVENHLPDAALLQQKRAFRRGLLLSGAVSGVVLAGMAGLAGFAFREALIARDSKDSALANAVKAETNARLAQHTAYVADMNLMPREWETNNIAHIQDLLKETENYPDKGFEWHYWQRLCNLSSTVLAEHKSAVSSVAVSSDGRSLMTASYDGSAILRDAKTGQLKATLTDSKKPLTSVCFSPDSSLLATAGDDGTVRLYKNVSGNSAPPELFSSLVSGSPLLAVAFSPDGTLIAACGREGKLQLWDIKTGQKRTQLVPVKPADSRTHLAPLTSLSFSSDGKHIAAGCEDNNALVWKIETGRQLFSMKGHSRAVKSVAFSPDGSQIATGSIDSTIRLWNAHTGQSLHEIKAHADMVYGVAFSPDGAALLSASQDNSAKLWDVKTGQERLRLRGHLAGVLAAAFSHDGKQIITGSLDGTARMWNATASHETTLCPGHKGIVFATNFSPDGKHLVTGSGDATAKLWDVETGTLLKTFGGKEGHKKLLFSATFSPDGKRIATAGDDDYALVWEVETGRPLFKLDHKFHLSSVAFSPDGSKIATGGYDSIIKLWDAKTGIWLRDLKAHDRPVKAIKFSQDGKFLVSGSQDKTAIVWNVEAGTVHRKTETGSFSHLTPIMGVDFAPDGKTIVTASYDKTAKLWDADTGKLLRTMQGHAGGIFAVAFSPDGKRIVTASEDNTARLWETESGKELLILTSPIKLEFSIAFSPDGKHIAAGGLDNRACIWSTTP